MILIDNNNISHYWDIDEVLSIAPFGTGHINDTYQVVTESTNYILQRVNKNVFRTKELVENYEVIAALVKEYQDRTEIKITPDIIRTREKSYHHIDAGGSAWRLVELIPNAQSYDISPDPEISFEAAEAIGRYQFFLSTITPESVQDTIPVFHNLEGRLETFLNTLENCDRELLDKAKSEVEQSLKYKTISKNSVELFQNLPLRVNHNDTKLNNIILDGAKWMVIDLDTVMKGYVMFDFGDMVRTFTSPAFEDEKDLSKTQFRIDHFEALTKGYLKPLKQSLTTSEKESLLDGAYYIIYEQVLRFLTDFLKGNVYYKVAYPDHNLVRTRTQLKLLKSIIEKETELRLIIEKYT